MINTYLFYSVRNNTTDQYFKYKILSVYFCNSSHNICATDNRKVSLQQHTLWTINYGSIRNLQPWRWEVWYPRSHHGRSGVWLVLLGWGRWRGCSTYGHLPCSGLKPNQNTTLRHYTEGASSIQVWNKGSTACSNLERKQYFKFKPIIKQYSVVYSSVEFRLEMK